MTEAIRFLGSFGRALSAATLYSADHPTLRRAIDTAWKDLADLIAASPNPAFTLLGETVLFGDLPLRDRRSWEWSARLSAAGLQRLEFDRDVEPEAFESFVFDVVARLAGQSLDSAAARQFAPRGIRSGSVGLRGREATAAAENIPAATLAFSLREEVETMRWMHDEVKVSRAVPLIEAEAIVRSLSVAMHSDRRVVLPLLQLKEFDQYTTTHSLNVAVLAMGLAEFLGLASRDVRAYGIAGLLHDLGKVRIPLDILTKPGALTAEERAVMNQHPAEGARIILRSEEHLDMAALVAYEHHIMIDGGGYPVRRNKRPCHPASILVHVCDVYDALRTDRPYRRAWSQEKTLGYLRERSGLEFEGAVVEDFIRMMEQCESQVAVLKSEDEVVRAPAPGQD
jgi:putative nucleotidyltransferase with HDIG domain